MVYSKDVTNIFTPNVEIMVWSLVKFLFPTNPFLLQPRILKNSCAHCENIIFPLNILVKWLKQPS